MADIVGWSILGIGFIAKQFARGLAVLPDAEFIAIGSRVRGTADAFGDEFDVPTRHATSVELVNNADVDVVHVGTPNQAHRSNSILALWAGTAVLFQKPFTINNAAVEWVIAVARTAGKFLMGAMWTRFIPAVVQVRRWISEGAIGEVRMLQGDCDFRAEIDEEKRLLDPVCGGGSLLDVGV